MDGNYEIVVGDRGRMVIPAPVREHVGIREGSRLSLLESRDGLVLLTREQLRERVRADLDGVDLVDALLAERRRASHDEDAA